MTRRAILGTLVFLLLAGTRAQGQAPRAAAAPALNRGSTASAAAVSQPSPVSRSHSGATANQHASISSRRDSGFFFSPSHGHAINHGRRVASSSASRYWELTPATPDHPRRPFDGRFHRDGRFNYCCPLSVVFIEELPSYIDSGDVSQYLPSPGWSDPGYYADPPATMPGPGQMPPFDPPTRVRDPDRLAPFDSPTRMRDPGQLAPFDPTPQEVVDRMLALAGINKGDVVHDLGAGDGRVVITAAKKYGAKAVGFEIDPGLVKLARENVLKQGVEKLVEIRQQDFLTADLSPATVVALYLSYDGNLALRPQLMRQLKPGARIVSYTFDMGDWQPKIVEAYRDAAGESHALYLWEIGAPLVFSDRRR